jgi:cell wall-associated NlpC family hydrolase
MDNSFTPSFASYTPKIAKDMQTFFGGSGELNDLYRQFTPQYGGVGGGMGGGGGTNFNYGSFGGSADQYSRFRPTYDTSHQAFLQQHLFTAPSAPTTTGITSGTGNAAQAGGNWAALDVHNAEINAAAAKVGVPANLLKSMINNESSGDWERDGFRSVDPDGYGELVPFVGVRRATAASVGIDYDQMIGNKALQIEAMARVLARDYKQYGSWEAAASNYFTGDPTAYQTGGTDSAGKPASTYVAKAIANWRQLDGASGASQDPASPMYGKPWADTHGNLATGNTQASDVVQVAVGYANQNLPYVLGSAPGKGQTPTSWDCSGMTWWLDQNYGSGNLPQGSHEQYTWAQSNGLFSDESQLRPGDLIFFNTGASYRGNAASHVTMYIGNGKVVHAANPSAGTIISDLSAYDQMYPNLGMVHMPWSGGGAGTPGTGTTTPGTTPTNPNLFSAQLGPALLGGMQASPFANWQGALAGMGAPNPFANWQRALAYGR